MLTFTVLLLCASLFNGVFSSAVRSFESLEVFPGGARYSVDSTVLLNDVARKNRETGYKIKAELNVEPIWSHGDEEFLLRFDLFSPKLHLRGKHVSAEFLPHKSEWDSHRSRPFYAHWNKGIIENVYVEPDEPLDFVNFKKSLVSLFQFQILDGEYTETDISGTCEVMYESLSIDVIRKFKRRCTWQGIVSSDSATDQQGLDAPLPVRRVHRIELGEGLKGVKSIMAEDAAAAARAAGVGVKARAFIRLQQIGSAPSPKPRPSLADAIPAGMNQEKLPLTPPKEEVKPVDLRSALAPHRSALEASEAAGGGGGAALARASLRLIPAFRAASKEALVKEMEDPANGEILTALVRLLGVTASPASHSAAHTHLQLARKATGDLPLKYLSAVPRAHNVQDSVTLELLRLASIAREPAVADSALLAAAAAAGGAGGAGDVGKTVAEGLAKERAKCKDDLCRSTRLLALGSLRRPDSLPLLLQSAGDSPGSAAAALTAVAKVAEVQPLTAQQMERVRRIAMQLDKPYPLEVRAQAIDLLLTQAAAQSTARGLDLLPCRLQALAGGLARAGEGDAELRR
ncbi:hypothetical protein JYU34_002044 [Plutella xylostella]|uniref:Vitellogenin domain-containing protein n=1 Tax=Plutella xylostella TaxID=51655 RepID=A0ABQ7R5D9_PLUXY|nr:hypothetical protein JYU34_002044 [Plutella xylostella]